MLCLCPRTTTILAGDADPLESSAMANLIEIQGGTSVYGVLSEIGVRPPRAVLEMSGDRILVVEMGEELAVKIVSADRLDQMVGLSGQATWRIDTWEMVRFRAEVLLSYDPRGTSLTHAIARLSEVSGPWEEMGEAEYIEDLRGE
jgi:hypothetical protein